MRSRNGPRARPSTVADLGGMARRVWNGDDAGARIARGVLAPASLAFGAVTKARDLLYRAGALAQHDAALPTLSVGNVTVGGTGKTPVASWFASRMRTRGASPAIVMRGYGDDEPRVHALLTPGVPVITNADRLRGVVEAKERGADVAVLDDAFQHRRVRRDVDVVLVSAEQLARTPRVLPAGPYRESLDALRRASAVIVTRKSASPDASQAAVDVVTRHVRDARIAIVALSLDAIRSTQDLADTGAGDPLQTIGGRRVLAIAAIGEPDAFFVQLERAGALVDRAPFADHHAFDADDVASLVHRADRADLVVCTLKDAVKLAPLWPRLERPLWYVSQRVAVERGGDVLDDLVARVLAARA